MNIVNPYGFPGSYYRVQLHCHTNVSDGALSLAQAVDMYRSRGFSILCITDHNRITDVSGLTDADMLVLPGAERVVSRFIWPLGRHLIRLGKHTDLRKVADCREMPGVAIAAHPTWAGNLGSGEWTVSDMLKYKGVSIMEVRNPHSSPQADMNRWLEALLARGPEAPLWGAAVDDMHNPNQVGYGWVEVKMQRLEADEFITALCRGSFYMSRALEADFNVKDGCIVAGSGRAVRLVCSDASGCVRAEAAGSLEYRPQGDETFLIVQCYDEQGGWACSQPFRIT